MLIGECAVNNRSLVYAEDCIKFPLLLMQLILNLCYKCMQMILSYLVFLVSLPIYILATYE